MKPHIDGWTNTPRDEGSGPQSRDDFREHADAALTSSALLGCRISPPASLGSSVIR